MQSPSHVYVFVNLRAKKDGEVIEYYVVPSSVVAEKTTGTEWESFYLKDALPFKDGWGIFLGEEKQNLTLRSRGTQ